MVAVLNESCEYDGMGPVSREQGPGLRPISLRSLHSPLPSQFSVPPSPASYGQCAPSEDSEIRLELFSESLQRLSREVRRHEDQQLAQQRHMVRLESTLQGLQEDQEVRTSRAPVDAPAVHLLCSGRLHAIERSQAALAAGAQRALRLALKTAEAQKSFCETQDEAHGRCVHETAQSSTRLQALERAVVEVEERLAKAAAGTELSGFSARLAHNEAAQKRLEQRMKQFEAEELEGRFSKLEAVTKELRTQLQEQAPGGRDAKQAEDIQNHLAKLEALASISDQGRQLRGCQSLADENAKQLKDLDTAMAELQGAAVAEALFGGSAAPEDDAPVKSDSGAEIEALSSQLARLEEQLGAARLPELRREMEDLRSGLRAPEPEAEAPIVEGVKVEPAAKAILELRGRLEDLAEIVDERNLSQMRQVASLVPELKAHVERFGKQCAQCSAKTEAFEVRLDLTRTNLDTQEQRLQALSERVEKGLVRSCLPPPGASRAVPGEKLTLFNKPKHVHFAPASCGDQLPTLLPKEPFFSMQSAKEPPAKIQEEVVQEAPSRSEENLPQDIPADKPAVEKTPPPSPVRSSISDFTGC
eukprot:s4579_g3.t1